MILHPIPARHDWKGPGKLKVFSVLALMLPGDATARNVRGPIQSAFQKWKALIVQELQNLPRTGKYNPELIPVHPTRSALEK
jgi:hypothetical protein